MLKEFNLSNSQREKGRNSFTTTTAAKAPTETLCLPSRAEYYTHQYKADAPLTSACILVLMTSSGCDITAANTPQKTLTDRRAYPSPPWLVRNISTHWIVRVRDIQQTNPGIPLGEKRGGKHIVSCLSIQDVSIKISESPRSSYIHHLVDESTG